MNDPILAAYYFPNYHPDPRNELRHGEGWTEWDLLRVAKPRFPGHQQPKTPLWGEEDESQPKVMARKIAAAADHGLDAWIFDWYWYEDQPFLQRALEDGFLKAENFERLKFATMWANHDWIQLFPAAPSSRAFDNAELLMPVHLEWASLEKLMDYHVENYFPHSNYLLINGCPYFSIYDIGVFVRSCGSVPLARRALDIFRSKTKAAGFPDLHINAILWGAPILPSESLPADPKSLLDSLAIDSFGTYVSIHHLYPAEYPATDDKVIREGYYSYWDRVSKEIPFPYFPNVTMGWDPTPRTEQSQDHLDGQYPYGPIISGNTPEAFREALAETYRRVRDQDDAQLITINAWNEWTEGSYLEPDTVNQYGYLEAIRSVTSENKSLAI